MVGQAGGERAGVGWRPRTEEGQPQDRWEQVEFAGRWGLV